MIFEAVLIIFNILLLGFVTAIMVRSGSRDDDCIETVEFIVLDTVNQFLQYATPGSACIDIRSPRDLILKPGEQIKLGSGLKIWIKDNRYVGLLFPRSGLGSKGLNLSHTVGVIDSDYQGEITIPLKNTGSENIVIERGQRIVQLGFFRIEHPVLRRKEKFSQETNRGRGGFGSTGIR